MVSSAKRGEGALWHRQRRRSSFKLDRQAPRKFQTKPNLEKPTQTLEPSTFRRDLTLRQAMILGLETLTRQRHIVNRQLAPGRTVEHSRNVEKQNLHTHPVTTEPPYDIYVESPKLARFVNVPSQKLSHTQAAADSMAAMSPRASDACNGVSL